MNRAVFLDRDGVINKIKTQRVNFVNSPDDLYLLPGAAEAIRILNVLPFLLYVPKSIAQILSNPNVRA